MTTKRIAAIAIAAVLIVAALLIRNGLDDDSSSATDGTDKPTGGKITVICSTEFEAICRQLPSTYTVTVEPAGDTLDRLAEAGAALPDAWITLDPFPGMIDVLRGVAGATPTSPMVLTVATDTPMLAVVKSLVPSVEALCGSTVSWKCAGSKAGQSIGAEAKLLPGITDPDSEASGLLTFANAVAGYFDSSALDTSAWQDNSGFATWLRTLTTTSKVNVAASGVEPLATLITRKTIVNVAATTASETTVSTRADAFTAFPLTPSIAYAAVVATFGNRAGSLASVVGPLLVNAGWTEAGDPKSTLPAGTFVALRTLWEGK